MQKRARSTSSGITIPCVERILESWVEEKIAKGGTRDMELLTKPFKDTINWKTTVPPVLTLTQTASLAERVALHAPNLLIRTAVVQAALLSMHRRDNFFKCSDGKVLGAAEDVTDTIRCIITRWRELKQYPVRLDSILNKCGESDGQVIVAVCGRIDPFAVSCSTVPKSPYRTEETGLKRLASWTPTSSSRSGSPRPSSCTELVPYEPVEQADDTHSAIAEFLTVANKFEMLLSRVAGRTFSRRTPLPSLTSSPTKVRAHQNVKPTVRRTPDEISMDEALASQKPLPCNYHGITKGIKQVVAAKKDAKEKIKVAKKEAAIATKAAATAKKAAAVKAAAKESAVTKVVGDDKSGCENLRKLRSTSGRKGSVKPTRLRTTRSIRRINAKKRQMRQAG